VLKIKNELPVQIADGDAWCVTHSGLFHADEVVAICLLTIAYPGDVHVFRTRKPHILNQALSDPRIHVIDVGESCNPAKLNFDHHKRAGGTYKSGIPKASAGLLWDAYGSDVVQAVYSRLSREHQQEGPTRLRKDLEQSVICEVRDILMGIDCIDVRAGKPQSSPEGVHWMPHMISAGVSRFNPLCTVEDTTFTECFTRAADWVLTWVDRTIEDVINQVVTRDIIYQEVDASLSEDRNYIVLRRPVPTAIWQHVLSDMPQSRPITFVLTPTHNGYYVDVALSPSRNAKVLFPVEWTHITGERLQQLLPEEIPPGAYCCKGSRTRFIHSTLLGATAIAEYMSNPKTR